MKKYNFSAGPAILPAPVLREAAKAAANYQGKGLSLLELSHRGPEFTAIMEEINPLVAELIQLPDNYKVLWLTGGASTQFFMAPMNLLNEDETAAYVDTGAWANKAIKEAKNFGQTQVLASSKEDNYTHIPKRYKVPANAKYLHLTSNNTIYGTQLKKLPQTDVPIVCDMSSDFLSRPIDIERYGMIYAGAQKNLGPAGVTCVIIREDMLGTVRRTLPAMLNYQTFIDKNSLYNTPPVFPIFVSLLTLRWLKSQGGVEAMDRKNRSKARLLYNEIDSNPLFFGPAAKPDRSLMNVAFVMEKGYESLQDEFLNECKANGLVGLKGHRSVGGFRASIYNAFPRAGVKVLVELMQEFARKKG
ncbi:MAG: 3-phosphoserine/phosphohydroxythreonine transaminase [Saprospiraceae bacterium]